MRTILISLGLGLALASAAVAEQRLSTLLRSQSGLSPEYQALIRPPVPGSLAGQPRRPSRIVTDEWGGIPIYSGASGVYEDMARVAARKHQIPEELFLRLVRHERASGRRRSRARGRSGWRS